MKFVKEDGKYYRKRKREEEKEERKGRDVSSLKNNRENERTEGKIKGIFWKLQEIDFR